MKMLTHFQLNHKDKIIEIVGGFKSKILFLYHETVFNVLLTSSFFLYLDYLLKYFSKNDVVVFEQKISELLF